MGIEANLPNIQLDSEVSQEVTSIDSNEISIVQLDTTEQELVTKIIQAPTRDELQKQFDLFNMNQSKKNALRIVKLNGLLDKVEDQAIERFQKRPDQISNKELLEFMNVISGQIDRAQKHVDALSAAPAIAITAQKTDVTINVGDNLDRDSKERVMDAISSLLKQVKNSAIISEPPVDSIPMIEADFEDKTLDIDASEPGSKADFYDSDSDDNKE